MLPSPTAEDAWALTRAISPRDRVRVAAQDASGAILNQYSRTWPTQRASPPNAPWAVPLADADGFRLIAFDLDAGRGEAAAARDTSVLADLLGRAGIPHLVCQSGPAGGRHIWVATTTPIDPGLIGTLARLAAAVLPSLDIAPLRNSATGCVRPPGAPHRDGGVSRILAGNLDCLLQPAVEKAAIDALVGLLAEQVTRGHLDIETAVPGGISVDAHGHPYLPGLKRSLPSASSTALDTDWAGEDASVVLNRILLGAAASHWRLTDVVELVPTAPGLEHIRSRRTTTGRRPRPQREQAATLARQWRYAVRFVAAHPRQPGLDTTFDTRAGNLTDLIRTLQERADAAVGRWTRGGGPTDRRVLDCLHRLALTAVTTDVEADIRRIALTCGIGRETARTALLRLAADRWIRRARPAAGVHGASWTIDPHRVLHRSGAPGRPQAATRPEGAGAAERLALLEQLSLRSTAAADDLFTGTRALSFAAGNLYARLHSCESLVHDQHALQQLLDYELITAGPTGWSPAPLGRREGVAHRLGVLGRLEGRRRRYLAERATWNWWQAEQEWMSQPRRRRHRRPGSDQTPLWQTVGIVHYPKYPRGLDGRADHSAARQAVQGGVLSPTLLAA